MESRHQNTARRRANSRSGVRIRKTDPVPGQAVDMRRPDLFLSIAPQIGIPEIVGQNKDDIRFTLCTGGLRGDGGGSQEGASAE